MDDWGDARVDRGYKRREANNNFWNSHHERTSLHNFLYVSYSWIIVLYVQNHNCPLQGKDVWNKDQDSIFGHLKSLTASRHLEIADKKIDCQGHLSDQKFLPRTEEENWQLFTSAQDLQVHSVRFFTADAGVKVTTKQAHSVSCSFQEGHHHARARILRDQNWTNGLIFLISVFVLNLGWSLLLIPYNLISIHKMMIDAVKFSLHPVIKTFISGNTLNNVVRGRERESMNEWNVPILSEWMN